MVVDLTERMVKRSPSTLRLEEGSGQTFAMRVREYRTSQGWSQAELAEQWGYSFETISAWERRKRFPARPEIPRLAQLLAVDVMELVRVVSFSKRTQARMQEHGRERAVPAEAAGPFEQGRLFWTLHLGVEHGRLQCVIACPLASGEVWEVPLDSVTDAEAIRRMHQMVHEHVSIKASGEKCD